VKFLEIHNSQGSVATRLRRGEIFNSIFICPLATAQHGTDYTRKITAIAYVKPIVEYNSAIWSPSTVRDIEVVERVQRRFTRRLPRLRHKCLMTND